jgi:hypothetical protein
MSDQYPPPPPPEQSGYQGMGSMPAPGSQPAAPAVSQPASIAMAVKLMYVGAALSLLGILVSFLMTDQIRESVEKASADQATPMTPDQIDTAVSVGIGFAVVSGLIGVGLWLWMASANGKGKSWARIVATVLFAFSLLAFLGSFIQNQPTLAIILSVVSVLLGAFIIFLLWKKESTAYYQAQSAPRI